MTGDPLQTLQAALNAEPNSASQGDILASLRESLESQPAPIRVLVPILLAKVVSVQAQDSLVKVWVIDLFHYTLCRSTLSLDVKTQISQQLLETLFQILDDPNPTIVKVVIQCLTAVYPLLFRYLCTNRNNPAPWTILTACKSKILSFVAFTGVNAGVRLSALKFMQRVILVQVPQGISDPRLQNKNDPNLSFCPANHPFISVSQLETEGQMLLKRVIELLYSSQNVPLLSALLNSWATLVKVRPNMIPLVVTALHQWTPAALTSTSTSASTSASAAQVRSAEKAVRILLIHISRIPNAAPFVNQINEALAVQAARMESAASEEKKRRAAGAAGAGGGSGSDSNKKRPTNEADRDRGDVKRVKLEAQVDGIGTGIGIGGRGTPTPTPVGSGGSTTTDTVSPTATATPQPPPQHQNQNQNQNQNANQSSMNLLSSFDFSSLPASLITDLIVANLEAFSEAELAGLVGRYRERVGGSGALTDTSMGMSGAAATSVHAPSVHASRSVHDTPPSQSQSQSQPQPLMPAPASVLVPVPVPVQDQGAESQVHAQVTKVKEEPEPPIVDPLQMDIDQDELEYEPERLNEELSRRGSRPDDIDVDQDSRLTRTRGQTRTRTRTRTRGRGRGRTRGGISHPSGSGSGSGSGSRSGNVPSDPSHDIDIDIDIDQEHDDDHDHEHDNDNDNDIDNDNEADADADVDIPLDFTLGADFKIPPPPVPSSEEERLRLVERGMERIFREAAEMRAQHGSGSGSGPGSGSGSGSGKTRGKDEDDLGMGMGVGVGEGREARRDGDRDRERGDKENMSTMGGPMDMWMLLVVRMVTRVVEPPGGLNGGGDGNGEDGRGVELIRNGDIGVREAEEKQKETEKLQEPGAETKAEVDVAAAVEGSGKDARPATGKEGAESSGGSSDVVVIRDASANSERNSLYDRQDKLRRTLCNYIMDDFSGRIRLATTWMNEEWYNDRIRVERDVNWKPNYDIWLSQIVASYQTHFDGGGAEMGGRSERNERDRTFSRFLLDLPSVPSDVLGLLRELCVERDSPDKMQIGFSTLRGFVTQRPLMRTDALNVLLELTTHPEKKIRGAAINTVKSVKVWMPTNPIDGMIREFALGLLRKLGKADGAPGGDGDAHSAVAAGAEEDVKVDRQRTDAGMAQGDAQADKMKVEGDVAMVDGTAGEEGEKQATEKNGTEEAAKEDGEEGEEGEENMEDGQLPPEELIQTPYLPERIELPADKSAVLQHVELLFALSVKSPDFLDELFAAYGQMDITVQEAIQQLITALVRSLGSSHGKLLTLMRTCPPGAESLALRVLTIFTEHGRPSPQLVALVKALINERDLDARFLIPIIAEMDKPDIMRHLPRIVSILNGQPEPKNLVRSVFSSVVTTPPQTFGSVTSNLPRVRQSELLTPAELMVLLHDSEKEIGIKSGIEAIGICFSMTDVFRSEILAVVMQQIMDEPVLPVLFLRTVIQAVTTYKSLVGFVSTTLLSRLITKKIWTNPPLWEGFIRCAKVIAPASFGALLQLPKDQLRELVDKQPSLKAGLRDYVTKKATNKARVSGFLDIFSEPGEGPGDGTATSNGTPPRTQPESSS